MKYELQIARKRFAGNKPAQTVIGNISQLTQARRGLIHSTAQACRIEAMLKLNQQSIEKHAADADQ